MVTPELSIVLPTCNRAPLLSRAIDAIAEGTSCEWELIVVNGASTDETAALLDHRADQLGARLRVIHETKREGFVRAANKGLRAARGKHLCWLNDDARPLPGALDLAVRQLNMADPALGLLAMFHRWHSTKNIAYVSQGDGKTFSVCHVRGTLYANFPIGRRQVWERLDYLDERYVFCASDPDLSLKAWHAGLTIEPAWGACIDHDEHADDRRAEDHPTMLRDNESLFAKWDLPPKNAERNDFDPRRPCTLRGLRQPSLAA